MAIQKVLVFFAFMLVGSFFYYCVDYHFVVSKAGGTIKNINLLNFLFSSAAAKNNDTVLLNSMPHICTDRENKNVGNNVLSYTLFGRNAWKRYGEYMTTLALEAASNSVYKDWSVRVYHDGLYLTDKLKKQYNEKNANLKFCNVRNLPVLGNLTHKNAMIWRFIPIVDLSVNITCVRDLDSPLLKRESDAVYSWMQTDKIMHIMRDNPQHVSTIMGGMWCFRGTKDRRLSKKVLDAVIRNSQDRTLSREADKGNDQNTLNAHMWPLIKDDVVQHDAFLCSHFTGSLPFPSQRDLGFVGCVRNYPNKECLKKGAICPIDCRPRNHREWEYC